MIGNALMLDPPHTYSEPFWKVSDSMWSLGFLISQLIRFFCSSTPGTTANHPYDGTKLQSLAGGAYEDWSNLPAMTVEHRKAALEQAIHRAIFQRIVPDGDCNITILPADMLSTYQRLITKLPPLYHHWYEFTSWDKEQRWHVSWILRHFWRLMTVNWSSETYERLQQLSTDGQPPRQHAMATYPGSEDTMRDDDPRMPNVLALEALIEDAIEPFWSAECFDPFATDLEERERRARAEARKRKRLITTSAAELALRSFADLQQKEFYWPESSRREGPKPFPRGGILVAFGVRCRMWRSGTDYCSMSQNVQSLEAARMGIVCKPRYNDTDRIKQYFQDESYIELVRDLENRERQKKRTGFEETDSERAKWEEKARFYKALREYRDFHKE